MRRFFCIFICGLVIAACAAPATATSAYRPSINSPTSAPLPGTAADELPATTSTPGPPTETPIPTMPPPLDPDYRNVAAFPAAETARLVVRGPEGSLHVIHLPEPVSPGLGWSANGLNNTFSAAANGFIYELRLDYLAVIGASGEAAVPFFTSSLTAGMEMVSTAPRNMVVRPGATPQTARLAWSVYGWDQSYSRFAQELFVVSPDGSNRIPLIVESAPGDFPFIEALRWSRDGGKLYYDRSPGGLGGWIPFGGATGLYVYDLTEGVSRELIAPDWMTPLCVGDLSRDERLTADNCNETYELAIRDLRTGRIIRIPHPAGGPDAGEIGVGRRTEAGGARFSPAAEKAAYGFNRSPDASQPTQSWVAVADIAGRKAKIIITARPDELVSVVGWLDEDRLLIQRGQSSGDGASTSSLWIIRADGTEEQPIAQGTLLAVMEP